MTFRRFEDTSSSTWPTAMAPNPPAPPVRETEEDQVDKSWNRGLACRPG